MSTSGTHPSVSKTAAKFLLPAAPCRWCVYLTRLLASGHKVLWVVPHGGRTYFQRQTCTRCGVTSEQMREAARWAAKDKGLPLVGMLNVPLEPLEWAHQRRNR